jgi:EAL domain-containing protein (putative c-di-GMP-specific phosphodiesterase class I)
MYQAKHAGKGRVALFAAAAHAAARDRLTLETDLRQAVEREDAAGRDAEPGALTVHFQPIVDLATGCVAAFEALARWTHPALGAVSPAEFIPLAEATGLIVPLGRRVLRAACAQAAGWDAPRGAAPAVSVNVSGWQLREEGLVDDVRAALADAALDPSRLTLEITESVLMEDVDRAIATLRALKALGVRLAIDDFGTGYSSLGRLRHLPVDEIKIDRAFVDDVGQVAGASALARTVIALGASLGLRTVAEGVEHAEQADALRAIGCDLAQGYHFARPMPGAAVPGWLARADATDDVQPAQGSARR